MIFERTLILCPMSYLPQDGCVYVYVCVFIYLEIVFCSWREAAPKTSAELTADGAWKLGLDEGRGRRCGECSQRLKPLQNFGFGIQLRQGRIITYLLDNTYGRLRHIGGGPD